MTIRLVKIMENSILTDVYKLKVKQIIL